MNIYIKIFFISIILSSTNVKADFYQPYDKDNPEKIEFEKGYCGNKVQEKKLMSAILNTAKYAIEEIPQLSAEQKQHIETELHHKNYDKTYAVASSAIFKMYVILIQLDNIKNISESYLDFHEKLRNSKKIKVVGNLLLKLFIIVNQRGIDNKNFQNSLLRDGYMLSDSQIQGLENALTNFDLLKINLAHQLICYGEKNNF